MEELFTKYFRDASSYQSIDPTCFNLQEFTETWLITHKEQLPIHVVRLMLPDEKELNSLKNQYPASGGDAGWIKDAYKNGYIDGCNRKRTDKHLRKPVKKHKPRGN